MCGLAAIVAADGSVNASAIRSLTRPVRHRGPDDEGYALFRAGGGVQLLAGRDTPAAVLGARLPYSPCHEDPQTQTASAAHVGFGHRRLAIVDLSPAGHQPLCDASGRYWVVYNGEVYNHVELRRELELRGRRFHSSSDTEVVVNAWAEWGEDCQQRFNGMWAFLIYDTRTARLHGSRDRFGIKPLYYAFLPGTGWAFASEVKQFTALPGWKAVLDWQQAYDYLTCGLTDHTDETFFKGVRQLSAGCSFSLETSTSTEAQQPRVRRWYRVPAGACRISDDEAATSLRELLSDSVRLRLHADVPVGSCLSGGMDSSSIVCLANEQLRRMDRADVQHVVSSYCELPGFDERRYVAQVVEQTGVALHAVSPQPSRLFETLGDLTWHQDAPFGSSSVFAQWCVFAEARRQRLLVMLDGQGADEQLAGYPSFFGAWLAELLLRLRWLRLGRELAGLAKREMWGLSYSLRQMARHLPMPAPLKRRLRQHADGRASMLSEVLHLGTLLERGVAPEVSLSRAYGDGCSVRGKSLSQLTSTQLPALLRYEDRNSMAHSVESRVPFLDYRLVEFLLSLPGGVKIRNGRTKFVLRQAMRGVIPKSILQRDDKIAFGTPEAIWFRGACAEPFGCLLREAGEIFPGAIDAAAMEAYWEAVRQGRKPYDSSLWRLASLAAWAKRFSVSDTAGNSVARAA